MGQLRFRDGPTYFLDACTVRNYSTQVSSSGGQANGLATSVGFLVHWFACVPRNPSGRDGVERHSPFSTYFAAFLCRRQHLVSERSFRPQPAKRVPIC
jgi:hypothetical protein